VSIPVTARTEATTADLATYEDDWSINTLLAQRVERSGERTMFERKVDGEWRRVSAAAFDAEVAAAAKGLIAKGIGPGDRVAIMSRTRYEWTVLDFAAWAAAAVPVPVYETSSASQVEWIFADAGVKVAVVETREHAERLAAISSDDVRLTESLVIDDGALDALAAAGAEIDDAELARRRALPVLDDLATIIYTSGTTGRPKGVELTHRNFVSHALNGAHPDGFGEVCAVPGARTLLFLPLAHVFARYIEVLIVPSGAVLGHTPNTADLSADLATFRPTFILGVPRIFELVYNRAEQKAGSGLKLKIFRWSAKVSAAWSRSLGAPGGPPITLRVAHAAADRLVLHKIRAALGGQVAWAVSGGAPLGARLGHFYRGLGLQVLEGYGLTETTAPTAITRPGHTKIGTVGPPFPGTSARIAADGEILVKGGHVFRGYRNNPAATAEAFTDGWFRTGDIGVLDDEGYMRITGRAKEIIVTASGKNVAPAVLEDRLRSHPLVSQCIVVGDERPFIAALVTLDAAMLPGWLANHGLPEMSIGEAATNEAVRSSIQRAIDRANHAVSQAESIRVFTVLDVDFTEAGGHLTPSLKVKRGQVLADFAEAIDRLYADATERRRAAG
jgi:long-chain acyl-CoA synthetase